MQNEQVILNSNENESISDNIFENLFDFENALNNTFKTYNI